MSTPPHDPSGAGALRAAGDRAMRELILGHPDGLLVTDVSGTVLFANAAASTLLRETGELLVGTDFGHPTVLGELTEIDITQTSVVAEMRVSEVTWQDLPARLVALRDVTAQRRSLAALRAGEERLRRVFDEGLSAQLLANPTGAIIRVNATLAKMLGRSPSDLDGVRLHDLFVDRTDQDIITEFLARGEGRLLSEMSLAQAAGPPLCALVGLSWLVADDNGQDLLVQIQDLTAQRAAERRLTELALRDELTGLHNRRLLLDRCERAIAVARSGRTASTNVAALFVDLDGFKDVNDRLGHERGDQVLIEIAHDLQTTVRPGDTVARVGGDEFVVLVEQCDDWHSLRELADRITAVIRRLVTSEASALPVTASVGVAVVDPAREPEVSPEQLLRRADMAMYRAKERGRDRHDVFDAELSEVGEARLRLEQDVRSGLLENRIALVFQPVVDIETQTVVGAEALLRLTDSSGRLLPTLPAVIAAETAGLAADLGDRVLELALSAASDWSEHLSVAVNISARELAGRGLRARIEQALSRHDFDASRLILEVTESSILAAGPSAVGDLERLRARGVKIAIDDFGTAYATLANLIILPVDILKVDAAFTAGLPDRRTHAAIVHGVASMAAELGIPCIVEGVETQAQSDALNGMGVRAQGWLWGQPRGPGHTPSMLPDGPR